MSDHIKILFLINGKSRRLKKIKHQLSSATLPDHQVIITEKARTSKEIIEKNKHDFTHIIAVGGDGTVHEVINGIMARADEKKLPVLSVIPAGTANDFCKTLSFPETIPELIYLLENPVIKKIDLGLISYIDSDGNPQDTWFNNIADIGIGAAVVGHVNSQPKYLNANIAFFKAIIKAFRTYQNIPIRCETDDWKWEGIMKMLVVANGKYFGSGLCIAPHAEIDNGKLAVTIGGNISTLDYIKNLPLLKKSKKIHHPQLWYKEAKEIKITSSEKCAVEADGELLGYAPLTIKIVPKQLNVLVKN